MQWGASVVIGAWCACLSSGQAFLAGQSPTGTESPLERAIRQGSVETIVIREYPPGATLEDLSESADAIVRVLITSAHSRLSANGKFAETDYNALVLEVIGTKILPSALAQSIVVSRPGGTLILGGGQNKTVERDFPEFVLSEEYVLFLKMDESSKRFVLPFGGQAAFVVENGRVRQMSEVFGHWNEERPGVTLEIFRELAKSALVVRTP